MTPNEKPLQPFFNALLSFHARGFVLVGKNLIHAEGFPRTLATREGWFLFKRILFLMQRFNAVLLHDSLPVPDYVY